jgi:hypothetical protein
MNTEQREVARWWHSGREYQAGVMLLAMFSKNKVLVHTLMKQTGKFGHRKLEYELPKAVGLNRDKMPKVVAIAEQQPLLSSSPLTKGVPEERGGGIGNVRANPPLIPPFSKGDEEPESSIQNPRLNDAVGQAESSNQYPAIIRRLKYEYSELYNKRSVMHKQMAAVPTKNSQVNMTQRAMLLATIKETTDRMDYLYAFEQAYTEKGIVPLEEEIWPPDEKPEEIPTDAEGLKKLKKNLQTYNSKARNVLLYQSKYKTDQEHPMPKGPKRQRVEIAIKRREEMIEEIERRLFELEQGNAH